MTDTNVATIGQKTEAPIVVLRNRLIERKGELKAALTDIDPDHFIRALVTSAHVNPELQACSFASLWLACMRACRDGLLPDGREGAIIPYKSTATWIPMYQGLLKRFRQSGQCRWIGADIVRTGELFEHYVDETGEHFKHVPGGNETATIEKVYAAAMTKDGAFYVAVLGMTEVNKIKGVSKASRDDAPWKMWPEEMMKKTALRRLSKLLPAGRDIFADEDEENYLVPMPMIPADKAATIAAISESQRVPGAASALDQFAGAPAETRSEQPGEGVTEGGGGGPPEAPATANPDNANPGEGISDPFSIAYERGQIARTTGASRQEFPSEYRDRNAKTELEAWRAGFDDKPFTNPKTGEIYGEAAGS